MIGKLKKKHLNLVKDQGEIERELEAVVVLTLVTVAENVRDGRTGNESSHVKQTPERRKGLEEKAISRKEA